MVQSIPSNDDLYAMNTFQVPTPGLSAFLLIEVTSQPDSGVVSYGSAPQRS